MAVTVEQIKREFPEFANTSPDLLAAKIADAYASLSQTAFGTNYDQAVKYAACHLCALSPSGEFARLGKADSDGATTTYERRFKLLMRGIAGPMVT